MKLRNITSLFLMASGTMILLTGITLLLRTTGLLPSSIISITKSVHEYVSPIFAITMIIHTYLNIKPLKNYIINKMGKPTMAFVSSVLIVGALSTYLVYGVVTAPAPTTTISMNNVPLTTIMESINADEKTAIEYLTSIGYTIPSDVLTINSIASANAMSPKKVTADLTKSIN